MKGRWSQSVHGLSKRCAAVLTVVVVECLLRKCLDNERVRYDNERGTNCTRCVVVRHLLVLVCR